MENERGFIKCGLCQNTGTASALNVYEMVGDRRKLLTSDIFSCELRSKYLADKVDYYQVSYACKCTKGQDINSSREKTWETFGRNENQPCLAEANVNIVEYEEDLKLEIF